MQIHLLEDTEQSGCISAWVSRLACSVDLYFLPHVTVGEHRDVIAIWDEWNQCQGLSCLCP